MNRAEKSNHAPLQTIFLNAMEHPERAGKQSSQCASRRHTLKEPISTIHPPRIGRSGKPFRLKIFVLFMTLASGHMLHAEDYGSPEYQVKAAFLFHFSQFVEWPPDTFKGPGTPLTFCTVGEDPFRGALEQNMNGKTTGTRPLSVRHFMRLQEAASCQVLFLGKRSRLLEEEAIAFFAKRPVLIVGESEHFALEGGMIGLCVEENTIRFEINLQAAEKSQLKISARLLSLAKTVVGNSRGN
jgi:hypothetical protein